MTLTVGTSLMAMTFHVMTELTLRGECLKPKKYLIFFYLCVNVNFTLQYLKIIMHVNDDDFFNF